MQEMKCTKPKCIYL